MTTPTSPTTTSATSAQPAISRLHPFDGLFLRAEHLNRMQEYTRELTGVLGQAGGPGVVYGYGIGLHGDVLEVTPGLAIDPAGRPLLMASTLSVPLDGLTKTTDGLWVIEVTGKDVPFGDEEIYGALCDDPCSGPTSTRPFIGEPVAVRLREDHLANVEGSSPQERRSRVASAWFERERKEAAALLPTSEPDATKLADFGFASWNEPTGLPAGDAVPIGVLLRVSGQWDVDAWIARRDRLETPPRRSWQQRLGMRPLDVFLAQLLQFQLHLASQLSRTSVAMVGLAHAHLAVSKLDEAAEELRHRRTKTALEIVEAASSALQGILEVGSTGRGLLVEAGFLELPPAGYLPLSKSAFSLEDEVQMMLGPLVTLRFCLCRPDFVAHAVEEAQHLDRIPLTARNPTPQVDILVPDGTRDGDGPLTTAHNWVAFHRRRSLDCDGPPQRETVEVYRYRAKADGQYQQVIQHLLQGRPPQQLDDHLSITFAADPMAFPAPDVPPAMVGWAADTTGTTLVALATPERRALTGQRAASLVPILSSPVPVVGPITAVAQSEAIYVILDLAPGVIN